MFQLVQVLYVPLKAKLLGLVQSSKGWFVNLDLQFPQVGRGQPQRCKPKLFFFSKYSCIFRKSTKFWGITTQSRTATKLCKWAKRPEIQKGIYVLSPRTHSASWSSVTHLSESCLRTGTSWKTWNGTSMPGTGSTTQCTASTSWRSTGSRRRRTPRRRRSWGGSRPGGSSSRTCSTPPSPSSTNTGCRSGCFARPASSSESAKHLLHILHFLHLFAQWSHQILRYDVIAKMETFSEDTQFTLAQVGILPNNYYFSETNKSFYFSKKTKVSWK